MNLQTVCILTLPFLGTALGAACVYLIRDLSNSNLQRILNGFAAGVMTAASIWSLVLPAMEQAAGMGKLSFLPAVGGLWAGYLFLQLLERLIKRLCPTDPSHRSVLPLVLAVTLHNLPEGMAVGVVAAGWLHDAAGVNAATALMLSLGIALQNVPEGAIISLPLHSGGMGRGKAFGCGVLSGAVEPVGTVLTLCFAALIVPGLPWLLSFTAGTMLYVVVRELIPQAADTKGSLCFMAGFTVMMVLDVVLG